MTDTDLAMTIPSDVRMVAPVRSFMRKVGEALGCEVDSELLALLTTELVTNAIRVQAGFVTITVTRLFVSTLRVEAHDEGEGWPQMSKPFPLDDDGGRGLMIVDRLSDSWGARTGECDGTTVSPRPSSAISRMPRTSSPLPPNCQRSRATPGCLHSSTRWSHCSPGSVCTSTLTSLR